MTTPFDPKPRLGTADDATSYIDIARRLESGTIDGGTCVELMRRAWIEERTLLPKGIFHALMQVLTFKDASRSTIEHETRAATRELIQEYVELKKRESIGEHHGGSWTLPNGDKLYDSSAVPQGTTAEIVPYLNVVHAFVDGSMDANTFQHSYLDLQRNESWLTPDGIYPAMQQIFYAIEDYVEYDHLRDPGELDADQFRARVTELEPELIARYEEARRRETQLLRGGTGGDLEDTN